MKSYSARGFQKGAQREYALTRNYVALGEYLQEMRVKAGLTQREVSLELGYSSAQFISNFERGISSPPLKKLKELIRMYRMPVEKVMGLVLEGEREVLVAALRSQGPGRRAGARI
ncbi:MAG: helix-turn-helix domain-containing protein [Bdellovibrionota bacterium]